MKTFSSISEAREYAATNIHKNSGEIATVMGMPSFLCSTGIPLERRLREPIEIAVKDFLDELGINDSEDISMEIGAEVCSRLVDMIQDRANVNIISAWLDY